MGAPGMLAAKEMLKDLRGGEAVERGSGYDIIVVGAGHNGLTAAAYLAKAGKKSAGAGAAQDRRRIGRHRGVRAGFQRRCGVDRWNAAPGHREGPGARVAGGRPRGRRSFHCWVMDSSLVLDAEPTKAAESIRRFSEKDAARWPEFVLFMDRAAAFLDEAYATIMPRLPKGMSLREGLGLAEMGIDLRLMGRKDMLRFIRMLPMTAVEFLEEWFESEELKAALASVAIHAATLGPMSAGTGYTLLHNWLNRGGLSHVNVGEAGAITQALAEAVRRFGGDIRPGYEVERILVDTYTCTGVMLVGGEEIGAGAVISSVDPKRTFLSLVEPVNLPPEFVWKTQSIKMRGAVSKLHLLTDGTSRHTGRNGRPGAIAGVPGACLRRGEVRCDLREAVS